MSADGAEQRHEEDPREEELAEDEIADVDVFTSVTASELRFGAVPETQVWFEGEPGQRSSSRSARENLPDEVEPRVTYYDVKVGWRARSRIVHPTDPDAS